MEAVFRGEVLVAADVAVDAQAGAGVDVLARVGSGEAAGRIVAVQQGALMATSFHPEVGPESSTGDRIHQYFLDLVLKS